MSLFDAVVSGDSRRVKRLLDSGASTEECDEEGETPLCYAAQYGRLKIAKLLLDAGANPRVKSQPILQAVSSGRYGVFCELRRRYPELLRELLCSSSAAPLEVLRLAEPHGKIAAIVRQEIDAAGLSGAQRPKSRVVVRGKAGREERLLVEAVAENKIATVRRKLARGVEVNCGAHPPLAVAAGSGKGEMIRLLLDAGANPQLGIKDGPSPLTKSILAGKLEDARLLVEAGADPLAPDESGVTPGLALWRSPPRKSKAEVARWFLSLSTVQNASAKDLGLSASQLRSLRAHSR